MLIFFWPSPLIELTLDSTQGRMLACSGVCSELTIFSGLRFRWSAAGSLGAGRRFTPQRLLGYEFDGDSSANIWATQTPRAVASLKIIICWHKQRCSQADSATQTNEHSRASLSFQVNCIWIKTKLIQRLLYKLAS